MLLTPLLLIKVLIGMLALIALAFIVIIWWLNRNNFELKISVKQHGAVILKTIRGRESNGHFYPIWSLKNHLWNDDRFKNISPFAINKESAPIIGVKYTAFLLENDNQMFVIKPPYKDSKEMLNITDTMLSWISVSKDELFKNTEPQKSAKDILQEIALPMGMMILAICCILFFPKMYAAITASANEAIRTGTTTLSNMMEKFIPLG